MLRRGRRSGVRFIEDEKERGLTFFKRRAGLYKTAADLSTLTGARIAVVLKSENGKISSFGTPLVEPTIDAFLSGYTAMESFANQEQKAKITILQNKLFKVEREKVVEDKRKKKVMAQVKVVQESSRIGKLIFSKEEDLDTDELYELIHDLTPILKEIRHHLPRLDLGKQVGVGGPRDLPQWHSSWPHLMQSHIPPPSRHSPWTPVQPSLHIRQPPLSRPMVVRSHTSLSTSVTLPSSLLPPQMMPHHSCNYPIWGKSNNCNNSCPFLPSSPLSSFPQFPSLQPPESQLPHRPNVHKNWVRPPQNYARQMNFYSRSSGENGVQDSGVHNILLSPAFYKDNCVGGEL
ncbi:hypothetical protein ACP4OV_027385 [Aristida adscensionis]